VLRLLAVGLLGFEDRYFGFPELLFVFGGFGFGSGYIRPSLFLRSLGPGAALGKNSLQRLMYQKMVQNVQSEQQHRRRDGSEQ
jgi:hypothetical protein